MDYVTRSIEAFLRMVDDGDPLGTVILTIVLLFLGSSATKSRPKAHRLGGYAAALISTSYALYALAAYGRMEPVCLLGILWRSLLAAGIGYGAAALAAVMGAALVRLPGETASRWIDRTSKAIAQRQDAHRRRAEQQAAAELERREAPAREEARRARERAAREAANLKSMEDQLRYDLRVHYQALRHDVQAQFSPDEFNEMLDQALAAPSAKEIHRRVAKLEELLAALRSPSSAPGGSLEDLVLQYRKRREDVASSSLPEPEKDKLVRWLNREENQRLHQFVMEANQ